VRELAMCCTNLTSYLFGRGKSEEAVFTVRVVPLMHLIIFFILAPPALLVFYGLVVSEFNWFLVIVNFSFWGLLFLLFLHSVLSSKLYVYEWGFRYRLNAMPFDEISKIRLKLRWRLLVVNRCGGNWLVDQNWYLLHNPLGFGREVKHVKPELSIEYE
jgi:hypothetical protein